MEHRRVRRVDFVLAVNPAGGKNADGRCFHFVHRADLHGACLRAKKDLLVVRDIERVAAVSRGMVLCDVQTGEVIVGKLYLGAVEYAEAHGNEEILRLVERLVHRVPVAQLHGRAGNGHVDGFGL